LRLALVFSSICGVIFAQGTEVSLQAGRVTSGAAQPRTNSKSAKPEFAISVPTLGYLLDATGLSLTPIRGLASAPSLGEPINKPNGTGQIFLPPRQHYALAELPGTGGIAVWHLARRHIADARDIVDPISGFNGKADVIAFSPTGRSAAIYSTSEQRIKVVAGLPGNPSVLARIAQSSSGEPTNIFISDDGRLVLTTNTNGQVSLSVDGAPLHTLAWTYSPMTLSFVSNTHNLLVSDDRQKQLLLIQNVEAPNAPPLLPGSNIQPDHLAVCNDGGTIAALDAKNQKLWVMDAKSLAVTAVPVTQQADELMILRDGHTLLLSASPLFVMKLADSAASAGMTTAGLNVR